MRIHATVPWAVLGVAAGAATPAMAQGTSRASVDSAGVEGNVGSGSFTDAPSISGDGRFVAFDSAATNLVAADGNAVFDVFVHDRRTGATTRVSVDSAGAEGNDGSFHASISADGRYVAFDSGASNLVANDKNGFSDVFVFDRDTATPTRVSVDSAGAEANNGADRPSISADGRFVAFESSSTNLVPGDTNGVFDVFVHDRQSAITTRVSVDSAGVEGNSASFGQSISADGRYVAFMTDASNLVAGDTNGTYDVFVHDLQTSMTTRVSVDSAGAEGNSYSEYPSISADGRFVAFFSHASNLVTADTNSHVDIFVHDCQTAATTRVSLDSADAEANSDSVNPWISADGRFVAFDSFASNLVAGDTNGATDVFVRDRQTAKTTRMSVDSSGMEGNIDSYEPSISADGRFVAFHSYATNLVASDTNGDLDVFVHGPYLTLEADPANVTAGNLLTFTAWQGNALGLTMLVAVDLNGSPIFVPTILGNFDVGGLWTFSGTVPSGLAGNVATFQSFGIVPTGKVGVSDRVAITFQ